MKKINLITLLLLLSITITYGQIDNDPDEIFQINSDLSFDQIRGEYGVWYKDDNCSEKGGINHENQITKPFIICEGFDIDGALDLPGLYVQSNGSDNFLLSLREDGYDIIILNLWDNTKAISKNSRLLQRLIIEINTIVENNSLNNGTYIHRPILMGVSMGGLIARHALCTMELTGVEHHVEKLLTMDTPHQGANIPLGLANLADIALGPLGDFQQVRSLISAFNIPDPLTVLESTLFPNWTGTLSTEAALEMAINYPKVNPNRTLFLQEMNSLGRYPTETRLVGISCGSNGLNQEGLNAGDIMIDWRKDIFCLIDKSVGLPFDLGSIDVRACPLTFGARVWAMPGNDIGQITWLNFGSEIGLNSNYIGTGISKFHYLHRDLVNAPLTRSFNVDHVAGGFLSYNQFQLNLLQQALEDADINWSWNYSKEFCDPTGVLGCLEVEFVNIDIHINNILGTLEYVPQFCFVPTVSSLDLNTHNWDYNVAGLGSYPHNKSMTPFDAIYWNNTNTFHASMDEGNMPIFVMSEVSPENLFIQNRIFEDGYTNTFEARGYIALGKDVDLVTNRTLEGNVLIKSGANITLSYDSIADFVYFDDGFEVEIGAELEVVGNNLPTCTPPVSAPTPTALPTWATLRSTNDNLSHEKEYVTINEYSPEEKKYVDNHRNASKAILAAYVYPSPTVENANLSLMLHQEETLTITVYNTLGHQVMVLAEDEKFHSGPHELNIPASNFKKGTYIIKINGEYISHSLKLNVL